PFPRDPHQSFAVAVRVLTTDPGRVVARRGVLELDEAASERLLRAFALGLDGRHLRTDARLAELRVVVLPDDAAVLGEHLRDVLMAHPPLEAIRHARQARDRRWLALAGLA